MRGAPCLLVLALVGMAHGQFGFQFEDMFGGGGGGGPEEQGDGRAPGAQPEAPGARTAPPRPPPAAASPALCRLTPLPPHTRGPLSSLTRLRRPAEKGFLCSDTGYVVDLPVQCPCPGHMVRAARAPPTPQGPPPPRVLWVPRMLRGGAGDQVQAG